MIRSHLLERAEPLKLSIDKVMIESVSERFGQRVQIELFQAKKKRELVIFEFLKSHSTLTHPQQQTNYTWTVVSALDTRETSAYNRRTSK